MDFVCSILVNFVLLKNFVVFLFLFRVGAGQRVEGEEGNMKRS